MILVDLVITVLQVIVCSASQDILYPCSIKMREVLGNSLLVPEIGGIQTFSHHKSFPWGWIRKNILDGMYGLVESKCLL